jgi:hypothetical protein
MPTLAQCNKFPAYVTAWDEPLEPVLHVKGGVVNAVTDCTLVDRHTFEIMELREYKADGKTFLDYDTKYDLSARVAVKKHKIAKTRSQFKCMTKITRNYIMRLLTGMVVSTGTRNSLAAFLSLIADAVSLNLYRFREKTPQFIVSTYRVVNEPCGHDFETFGILVHELHKVSEPDFIVSFQQGKFPGVVLRHVDSDASATIFRSGKLNSAGLHRAGMHAFINKIVAFILRHPEVHEPLDTEGIAGKARRQAKKQRKKVFRDPRALRGVGNLPAACNLPPPLC